MQKRYRNWIF